MITKFLRILLNESGMEGMYQFAPGERHVELVAAQSQVASLVAAYDALAPKPDEWPDGAQWYTIDADGIPRWHIENPSRIVACDKILIPLGVDWRLCIWQRPEVTA